jgi:electron transport complex protein RnfA
MLGLCPFFCISKNPTHVFGLGITVTFVLGITTACTWLVQNAVLIPYHIVSLYLIVFILIIATVVQLMEMVLQKFSPKLFEVLGMNLPLITADCAILGASLINTGHNPVTGLPFTLAEACINGIASGVGFSVVLLLMAGIREKLSLGHGFKSLQGLPIALIIAGLMAMAFFGFTGLHFISAVGGQ